MDLKTFIKFYKEDPLKMRRGELLKFIGLLLEERNGMHKRFEAAKKRAQRKKRAQKKKES